MARTNNLTNFLTDVAAAIKAKLGDQTDIPASQFDTKIGEIETGGTYQSKTVNVVTNGSQTITPDTGYDALSSVLINVQVPIPSLQTKTYEFTQNTHIILSPEQGYDGFSSIDLTINVPGSTINNQDKTITQNGTYMADSGYTGLGTVTVNVPGQDLSDATATPRYIINGKTAYTGDGKITGNLNAARIFTTTEEMNLYTPDVNELGIVYTKNKPLAVFSKDTIFSKMKFKPTFTIPSTYTREYYNVELSKYWDGVSYENGYTDIRLDMYKGDDHYEPYIEIRLYDGSQDTTYNIQYTYDSTTGTYTLNEESEHDWIDMNCLMSFSDTDYGDVDNESVSFFNNIIIVSGANMGGLFIGTEEPLLTECHPALISAVIRTSSTSYTFDDTTGYDITKTVNLDKLYDCILNYFDFSKVSQSYDTYAALVWDTNDNMIVFINKYSWPSNIPTLTYVNNTILPGKFSSDNGTNVPIYYKLTVAEQNGDYIVTNEVQQTATITSKTKYYVVSYPLLNAVTIPLPFMQIDDGVPRKHYNSNRPNDKIIVAPVDVTTDNYTLNDYVGQYNTEHVWSSVEMQFTLSDSNQLLPNIVALGKNGETTGNETIYNNLDDNLMFSNYLKTPVRDSNTYPEWSVTTSENYLNTLLISNTGDKNIIHRTKLTNTVALVHNSTSYYDGGTYHTENYMWGVNRTYDGSEYGFFVFQINRTTGEVKQFYQGGNPYGSTNNYYPQIVGSDTRCIVMSGNSSIGKAYIYDFTNTPTYVGVVNSHVSPSGILDSDGTYYYSSKSGKTFYVYKLVGTTVSTHWSTSMNSSNAPNITNDYVFIPTGSDYYTGAFWNWRTKTKVMNYTQASSYVNWAWYLYLKQCGSYLITSQIQSIGENKYLSIYDMTNHTAENVSFGTDSFNITYDKFVSQMLAYNDNYCGYIDCTQKQIVPFFNGNYRELFGILDTTNNSVSGTISIQQDGVTVSGQTFYQYNYSDKTITATSATNISKKATLVDTTATNYSLRLWKPRLSNKCLILENRLEEVTNGESE